MARPINLVPRLLCFFFCSFCFYTPPTTAQTCGTTCSGDQIAIRFPFGLSGGCSYPGFTLSCNSQNKTTLTLPNSVQFQVQNINYKYQRITIKDSNSCILKRVLNGSLNLAGTTPFYINSGLLFYNCSSEVDSSNDSRAKIVPCLSGRNYTTVVTPFESDYLGYRCRLIKVAYLPSWWWTYPDRANKYTLEWRKPDCSLCERRGGTCGFKSNNGLEIRCSVKCWLPRSAKYGIIIGIGVPVILCLIGLMSYIWSRIKGYGQRRNPAPEFSESQQRAVRTAGLDELTIESYPKTLLGENRPLPNPNDSTCPICLAEYQPKDALRSIPDCRHYFHVECIDEWLKMNRTCPLCRNSPGASSSYSASSTPSNAFSSSSSSSLLSSTV